MIGKMARDFRGALKAAARSDARFIWFGALAVIAAVLAEGFFEYNLGDSEVLTMFLVVVACGYLALEKDVASEFPKIRQAVPAAA